MSDRLWLGQGKNTWADTCLADFGGEVEKALMHFLRESQTQPMKVFAPTQDLLDTARHLWQERWETYSVGHIVGDVWRSPDDADWIIRTEDVQ